MKKMAMFKNWIKLLLRILNMSSMSVRMTQLTFAIISSSLSYHE